MTQDQHKRPPSQPPPFLSLMNWLTVGLGSLEVSWSNSKLSLYCTVPANEPVHVAHDGNHRTTSTILAAWDNANSTRRQLSISQAVHTVPRTNKCQISSVTNTQKYRPYLTSKNPILYPNLPLTLAQASQGENNLDIRRRRKSITQFPTTHTIGSSAST